MTVATIRQWLSFVICLLRFNSLGAQESGKPLQLEAALSSVEVAHPDLLAISIPEKAKSTRMDGLTARFVWLPDLDSNQAYIQ